MAKQKKENFQISIKTNLLDLKDREAPNMAVYAFSEGGRLLSRNKIDRGAGSLSIPGGETDRSVRIFVGPNLEGEEAPLAELLRRGAEERHLRIGPNIPTPELDVLIPSESWLCWLHGLCLIRGTVLKREIHGGKAFDLPVCNATVEIYEVDPWIIVLPKLPDFEIERIRDIILNPIDPPIPPIPPVREAFMPVQPPLPRPPQPFAAPVTRMAGAVQQIANLTDLQMLARSTNTDQFRNVLIRHIDDLRLVFCLHIPVTKQLIGTATTDECGRFSRLYFRGCNNPDQPDLYFIVKQKIFPFFPPFTIYEPKPVSCYTHWNYQCGTEVTLITHHPLAKTCAPCPPVIAPNNWVLVMAIGNHSLYDIHGTSSDLQATTTPQNTGLTRSGAPFGGLLRLRLEFDPGLISDLNVRYYRVSYRKGSSGVFKPMEEPVYRHYTKEVGTDLVIEPLQLGPFYPVGDQPFYKIPELPSGAIQWSFPDVREDTANAKLKVETLHPLAAPGVAWPEHGKYEFKIDLFDAGYNLVDIDALNIKYRIPEVTDLTSTIFTTDANTLSLVQDDDGDGRRSFIMPVHIDNSRCLATIAAPELNGSPAAANCGVMEYSSLSSDMIDMEYDADHPNGFATYYFNVKRGENDVVLPATGTTSQLPQSGPVPSGPQTNTQTVADLLDTCAIAGFAEDLYVYATATDGWSRLSGYDDREVRAFVLAPATGGGSGS